MTYSAVHLVVCAGAFNCNSIDDRLTKQLQSMRARRQQHTPPALHSCSPRGGLAFLACAHASCTNDWETAGFLRVADLSDLSLRVRLPADDTIEAIVVDADAGRLSSMGCVDTLQLTVDVSQSTVSLL